MAFWLASERRGQETSYVQRFDPRFWTVDFPRPAMGSIVTTGPDSFQIDIELHHEGELVGIIWDSKDTLDHPLLAYETNRDYSHSVLSFRWQSSGVATLDQVNGPTLTIEGRDEAGQQRTWYVRLWNYASGSPTDATISLPFSSLGSGWELPGDPIHPADIDRMFISVVAPNFVADSPTPLAGRLNGQVTISDVSCDGKHAMLETGDVLLPPHEERMATAYDDAYNQTPARLLRNIVGLGYRTQVLHYVGMSHFMRLEQSGSGELEVEESGVLCTPAEVWHRNFFKHCRANDFDAIVSISYELFDAFCPDDWKQRTASGEQALTGWIPPSTLLSPANSDAMAWLQASAIRFIELIELEDLPVRFQIGEPWWWVTPDDEICLYDNAAMATFGGAPPIIADVKGPKSAAEIALLDQAGALLSQSTQALADAVRNNAAGPAEILLLAFTPTILDPATPEMYRANLPTGWARPAFDRLQLEDYDWLTANAQGARREAYQFVDARLGYPTDEQDYLSGFVLNAPDAEALWPLIDAGLNEAADRGVSHRFVWALPQVCRDGFTRLRQFDEEDMQSFDDVLFPLPLGRDTSVAPEFSTSVQVTTSGHERRNSLWSDARINFDIGPGIRSEDDLTTLIAFFRARRGAARGFRLTDPFDFSSNGMTGIPGMSDQLLGTGDGMSSEFRLLKRYGTSSDQQVREISRPRPESIVISVDDQETTDWTLGDKGTIILGSAPAAGSEVRAGFLFDVPVRFAEDRIDVAGVNFEAGEAPSVPVVEIRETA